MPWDEHGGERCLGSCASLWIFSSPVRAPPPPEEHPALCHRGVSSTRACAVSHPTALRILLAPSPRAPADPAQPSGGRARCPRTTSHPRVAFPCVQIVVTSMFLPDHQAPSKERVSPPCVGGNRGFCWLIRSRSQVPERTPPPTCLVIHTV